MRKIQVTVRAEVDQDADMESIGEYSDSWQRGAYDRTHGGTAYIERRSYKYFIPEAIEALKGELEYAAKHGYSRGEVITRMREQAQNQIKFAEAMNNGYGQAGFFGLKVTIDGQEESCWGREYGYPGQDDKENLIDFFQDLLSHDFKKFYPAVLSLEHVSAYDALCDRQVMLAAKRELNWELEETQEFTVQIPVTPGEIMLAGWGASCGIICELRNDARKLDLSPYRYSPRKFKLARMRQYSALAQHCRNYLNAVASIPDQAFAIAD